MYENYYIMQEVLELFEVVIRPNAVQFGLFYAGYFRMPGTSAHCFSADNTGGNTV